MYLYIIFIYAQYFVQFTLPLEISYYLYNITKYSITK